MERLWSLAGATSGNRWQMRTRWESQKQAKTVAVSCAQLPIGPHGKEGVDGSSPSEGFTKALEAAPFELPQPFHIFQIAEIWNRIGNVAGPASLARLLWRRN
jgi:hypothetical protein